MAEDTPRDAQDLRLIGPVPAATGVLAPRIGRLRQAASGLSARLLMLTVSFVMLAEVLIFVPSIANFRNTWLMDRLSQARTAALVLDAAPDAMVPEPLVQQLLSSIETSAIVMKIGGTRRLLALSDPPDMVDQEIDLRARSPLPEIVQSFDTLLFGSDRTLRVIGPAPMGGDFVEIIMRERPLREAMLRFSGNILLLSLFISAITAGLVYAALSWLIVRPVKRLAAAITVFGQDPQDATRIIRPTGRTDEIGEAEAKLAEMEHALSQQLHQKERLAALGLAVAKINHDLRNMLASAQLFSERLGSVSDETAQRFAPKLVNALDRAVEFCEATLAFGRAQEPPPRPRSFDLALLCRDVTDMLGLDGPGAVAVDYAMPQPMMVRADPEFLFRILNNLMRNAVSALRAHATPDPRITLAARREGGEVVVEVADNGPGVPATLRPRLFEAFNSGGRRGGTGLGLAIAADLVRAQGGSIRLSDAPGGAVFIIRLPQQAG